ncbi:MAG: helix-turn-helix domain-containing protein [Clostridium neonatale]|uniref:helix-turn-helix domain-containing protein n=1 Tax=Clostridium neonatale TaxID=137838 RepID=UPI00291B7C18|nr:hypothetical protein CNEO3_600003 [Clostridium neonatale]
MEVKDIIKKRREELSLTYEQLGNMVGVGKSTVRKWETGLIENMRRDNIVALSKALNISPAIIMGWQPIEDDNKIILSKEETTLLENYNKLDNEDKNKVVDYTKLLSNQDKYKVLDNSSDEISATIDNVTTVDFNSNNKDDDEEVFVPYKSLDEIDGCNAAHADDLTEEEKILFDKISLDAINKRELEKFNARKKNK